MMRPILINGKFVEAKSNSAIEVHNPATLELIDSVPACGEADINAAVQAARDAQLAWWRLSGVEKAELMHEVAGADARQKACDRRAADAGNRQAAGRSRRLRQMVRPMLRLLRRDRPLGARAGRRARRRPPDQFRAQGALRRGRLHRAVQFPAAADRLEGRAGDRGRQHRGVQAAASEPAVGIDARRGL